MDNIDFDWDEAVGQLDERIKINDFSISNKISY